MSGVGKKEANCTKAASFVRVVLQERRGWSEDIAVAVEALDDGEPDVCHHSSNHIACLFLMHIISHIWREDGSVSAIGILLNESPASL